MKKELYPKKNQGFALFEALIALAITALGLLAIIGIQIRTLADTQSSIQRAQAIESINQLAELLKASPSSIGDFSLPTPPVFGFSGPPAAAPNCSTTFCTLSEKANWDRQQWYSNIQQTIPGGTAAIFIPSDQTNPNEIRQLGVIVSWRKNEKTNSDGTTNADYETPFNITTSGVPTCPSNRICHLEFIPLTMRCSPNKASGATRLYCPDPKTVF